MRMVIAVGLALSIALAAFGAKAPPTVVVTVRGATMTSTGTVYVEFPEQAATKGEVFTASVADASAAPSVVSGVLGSPWVQGLIYVAAGALLVFLFQFAKARLKLSGKLALAIVSAICAAAGVGLSSILGGLNVLNAGGGAALVIASAQLIYRLFVKK